MLELERRPTHGHACRQKGRVKGPVPKTHTVSCFVIPTTHLFGCISSPKHIVSGCRDPRTYRFELGRLPTDMLAAQKAMSKVPSQKHTVWGLHPNTAPFRGCRIPKTHAVSFFIIPRTHHFGGVASPKGRVQGRVPKTHRLGVYIHRTHFSGVLRPHTAPFRFLYALNAPFRGGCAPQRTVSSFPRPTTRRFEGVVSPQRTVSGVPRPYSNPERRTKPVVVRLIACRPLH
ncbi:hypothetical protein T484DRAFT_2129150 [Baffinella frigidus]|nr:hypothetical protein T484DRAFT_2129150 [Cryptophyta sp. CCMP2293]